MWKEAELRYAEGVREVFTDSDGGEDYEINIGSSSDVPNEEVPSKPISRSSGSSSDGSISGASSSQGKTKRSASQRFSKKFDNKLNQFKAETSQQLEEQLGMIKSDITKSNFTDIALETIKEGIISNTVQLSSVSNNLATSTERMENLMQTQITTYTERMKI